MDYTDGEEIEMAMRDAYDVYYDENVPLFRSNGYRKSGTMIPQVRNRDTILSRLLPASLLA